jgi:hypothetical protein
MGDKKYNKSKIDANVTGNLNDIKNLPDLCCPCWLLYAVILSILVKTTKLFLTEQKNH